MMTTVNRETLYQEVWQRPLTKLAKKYGISDVALAKACRKANIPLPGVGHWAKIAAGKTPLRPPLPSHNIETLEIGVNSVLKHKIGKPEEVPPVTQIPELNSLEVPSELVKPHPITLRTQKILAKFKPDPEGFISCSPRDGFNIWVSQAQLGRVLLFLDTVVKTLERLGVELKIGHGDEKTCAVIHGETVEFSLRERAVIHELPPPEKRDKLEILSDRKYYSHEATGELSFRIDEHLNGERKTWGDGKRSNLESKIKDVVRGVLVAGEVKKARTDYWAQRKQRWAEEEAERRQQRQDQEREQRELKGILDEADQWRDSAGILSYLDHIRSEMARCGLSPTPDGLSWLNESERRATSLDPTRLRLANLTNRT